MQSTCSCRSCRLSSASCSRLKVFGVVDVIRRQVADALHAAKATSTNASAQPTLSWWCPCCRRHHEHACCGALARVSPCKHCGDGHSNRSCSLRREQASARAIKAQLAASQLPANRGIAFGTFDAVPIHFSATQSASEVSEVARVERADALRSPAPARRTVVPQSPAAAHQAQPTAITHARGGGVTFSDVALGSPAVENTVLLCSGVAQGERTGVDQATGVTTAPTSVVYCRCSPSLPTALSSSTADAPIVTHGTLVVYCRCSHSLPTALSS
jgi:hypothetical protein